MPSFPVRRNTLVLFAALFLLSVFAWAGWANWEYRRQAVERASVLAAREGELVADASVTDDASGTPVANPLAALKGKPAPAFALPDMSGKKISLSSYRGKAVLINFWATWCAPCRSEIPLLETLHTEWAARGVSVVGIAVDHRDKVLEFAGRFKINYPLLIGEQDALDAADAFGVASPVFPFTVFTDRRGEVVTLFIGELHRPQAEFILSQVQSLNQDLIRLPAAQRAIAEGLRTM
jgi:peroxiredoxin